MPCTVEVDWAVSNLGLSWMCLCWEEKLFSFLFESSGWGNCKLTHNSQINRRKDRVYLHMMMGVAR